MRRGTDSRMSECESRRMWPKSRGTSIGMIVCGRFRDPSGSVAGRGATVCPASLMSRAAEMPGPLALIRVPEALAERLAHAARWTMASGSFGAGYFRDVASPEMGRDLVSYFAIWHYGGMAVRKMTFSLPEALVAQFLTKVASQDRSRFVSDALAARLQARDQDLIRACEIANQDLDVLAIETEFDGIRDEMAEPWK